MCLESFQTRRKMQEHGSISKKPETRLGTGLCIFCVHLSSCCSPLTLWPLRSLGRSEGGGSEVKVLFPWLLRFIFILYSWYTTWLDFWNYRGDILERMEKSKKTEVKPQWRDHCNMHTLGTNKHHGRYTFWESQSSQSVSNAWFCSSVLRTYQAHIIQIK